MLTNVYLHYVLDQWFERDVKPRLRCETHVIRYADEFICAFEREETEEPDGRTSGRTRRPKSPGKMRRLRGPLRSEFSSSLRTLPRKVGRLFSCCFLVGGHDQPTSQELWDTRCRNFRCRNFQKLQTPYFSRKSGRLGGFVVADNRTSQLAQMSQKNRVSGSRLLAAGRSGRDSVLATARRGSWPACSPPASHRRQELGAARSWVSENHL